jgi:hypothetical protein
MKDVLIIIIIFFVIIFLGKQINQKNSLPVHDPEFQRQLDEWQPFD